MEQGHNRNRYGYSCSADIRDQYRKPDCDCQQYGITQI
ncbi:Uncharacterised protein [Vibrio cholerae]|nr:Uncharacterised protein [Vibrio cholerae]